MQPYEIEKIELVLKEHGYRVSLTAEHARGIELALCEAYEDWERSNDWFDLGQAEAAYIEGYLQDNGLGE